jgi:Tfp pilus assembly protein PilE
MMRLRPRALAQASGAENHFSAAPYLSETGTKVKQLPKQSSEENHFELCHVAQAKHHYTMNP